MKCVTITVEEKLPVLHSVTLKARGGGHNCAQYHFYLLHGGEKVWEEWPYICWDEVNFEWSASPEKEGEELVVWLKEVRREEPVDVFVNGQQVDTYTYPEDEDTTHRYTL